MLLVLLLVLLVLLLCRRWQGALTRGGLRMIFLFILPRVRCLALLLLLVVVVLKEEKEGG